MITDAVRDTAATAAIFGFFASAWFGWAQERPPTSWRRPLAVCSFVSLATAAAGGILTWRLWEQETMFDDDTSRAFGVVVGVEVVLAVAGVAALAIRRRLDLAPVWVALIVGLHLFPVAALLEFPLLYGVATAVVAAAVVAVPWGMSRSLPISATSGLLTGSVLLVAALISLISALQMTSQMSAVT